MILIGNHTCSRGINGKSHMCLAKYFIIALALRTRAIMNYFAKHTCNFSLILLKPCNFTKLLILYQGAINKIRDAILVNFCSALTHFLSSKRFS